MANTARDVETILQSLEATTREVNPPLDTQKGPAATIYWAVANETSKTEVQAAYLRSLYQMEDPDLIEDADMFALSENYGQDPQLSKPSKGIVWFYRGSSPEPGNTYPVYVGTVVSTGDGRYNYVTTQFTSMNGDIAATYYNATTRKYEMPVPVEAVAEGTDYDLPPNTINIIITTQESFDGCINKDYMRSGKDPVDKYQLRDIIKNKTQGLDTSAEGSVSNILFETNPFGYDAFTIIPSSDLTTFARQAYLQDKMGTDVYVITDTVDETTQTGTAQGGETEIVLDYQPVYAVVYCLVDGVSVPFSVSYTANTAIAGSSRAQDKLMLTLALQPAQAYEIRYQYYSVIYEATQGISGRERFFGNDVIFRRATPAYIYITGQVTTIASLEKSTVLSDIRAFTTYFLRNPGNPQSSSRRQFCTLLDPASYQRQVEQTVDGVLQFKLDKFYRTDSHTMDVEYIALDGKTEYPELDAGFTIT
jgi:hypothetical protein